MLDIQPGLGNLHLIGEGFNNRTARSSLPDEYKERYNPPSIWSNPMVGWGLNHKWKKHLHLVA